ncbi:hypothetical protein GCM10022221_01630 [Actinocorallia aurea]
MITETPPETSAEGWDDALSGAFEILLGAPPATDDGAVYGVYHASDPFDEFLFPSPWATPEALTGREPTRLPDPDAEEYPFSPFAWRFDLGGSLFCLDPDLLAGSGPWGEGGHKGPRPFDDVFAADLRAVSAFGEGGEALVHGADLGPLLARHGVDLTGKGAGKLNGWLTVLLRVATDGTLTDAMRAATFTGRGPGHLVPMTRSRRAEEPWEERLGAVTYPGLRDHLRLLCLGDDDARSEGASYCGTGHWALNHVLEDLGCSLVAAWEFGESQAGTAVVRLPAGPGAHSAGR